jgi:hypothetical protein
MSKLGIQVNLKFVLVTFSGFKISWEWFLLFCSGDINECIHPFEASFFFGVVLVSKFSNPDRHHFTLKPIFT